MRDLFSAPAIPPRLAGQEVTKRVLMILQQNRIVRIGRCTPVSWNRGCFTPEPLWRLPTWGRSIRIQAWSYMLLLVLFSIRRFVDTWSSERGNTCHHLNNTWTFYFISNHVASDKAVCKVQPDGFSLLSSSFKIPIETICPLKGATKTNQDFAGA